MGPPVEVPGSYSRRRVLVRFRWGEEARMAVRVGFVFSACMLAVALFGVAMAMLFR